MEIIGFKVTRDEYEAKSKELVEELDRLISTSESVILQIVLTWDEFVTMLPELRRRQMPKDTYSAPEYQPYGCGADLSPPAKNLHGGGVFKGVELYYKDRTPTP